MLVVAFWIGALLLVLSVIKLWSASSTHGSYRQPQWWFWGDALWRGYRRTLLPASLVGVSFAIALTLPDPIGVYFGAAGLFCFFPLMVMIALFNWPKLLVPPASRSDSGALTEFLRRRRGQK